MKIIKTFTLLITLLITVNVFCQKTNLQVVTYRADWCPVTNAHEQRLNKEVKSFFKNDKSISFITHDITNPTKIKNSNTNLERLGVKNILSNLIYTGFSYIIDKNTKKLIGKISIAEQSYVIQKFLNEKALNPNSNVKPADETVTFISIEFTKKGGDKYLNQMDEKAQVLYAKYGFKVVGAMDPVQLYAGNGKANSINVPDRVVIFTAPKANSLAEVASDPEYQAIVKLRDKALNDFILIETKKIF